MFTTEVSYLLRCQDEYESSDLPYYIMDCVVSTQHASL